MNTSQILKDAASFVQKELENDHSGHDWWHIQRVVNTARTIAACEGADPFVCELAALLHDLVDEKLVQSEEIGVSNIRNWMITHHVPVDVIEHVIDIVLAVSFKGGNRPPMRTLEGKVVQDADRLDAIGAIGISRVFAYSGWKGRPIHDPDRLPRDHFTYEEYRTGTDTAIQHFYEKLLRLKEYMNTEYGKKLAQDRHRFMEEYLERFYKEWEGLL